MNELLACRIEPHDYVAEVGAGDGLFSLILRNIYRPAVLHINELYPLYIEVMRNQYEKLSDEIPTMTDFFVGTEAVTNLPAKYDKIIIRNTFHHFTEKKKMMKDITSKLNPGGEIVIIEVFKDNKKDETNQGPGAHNCLCRITEKEFFRLMKKFPLNCVSKQEIQGRTIMVFQKKIT